ncbi:MAG: CocE/NonD family hydrolase [Pseudomonadales bacterium]|nr:CocE/NonD family hydrolase [Pseudomonadales bacterium]
MSYPQHRIAPHHLGLLLMMLILLMLAGVASANTTTLGTRTALSNANPPLTDNANARWDGYWRPLQYPRAVTLPLQFIPTQSGKKIAVLVSVPADIFGNPIPGPFPVILTQTAYRIDLGSLLGSILPSQTTLLIGGKDKAMIRRGYISVAVDVYGTGMSSGVSKLLGEEEQQAYSDTVDWITEQPWFDGNLGLAGTSYLGIATLLTAEQRHPAVKAAFAEVPMGDPYRATVAPGGLLNANFINTWLTLTHTLSVSNDAALLSYPDHKDQINQATADHVAAIDEWYLPTINGGLDGDDGIATDDGDFWAVRSALEDVDQINVPTFIIGGSNDIFQRDQPLLYERLKNRVNTKLLILPGAHIQAILDGIVGHDNYFSRGAPGSQALLLKWFDKYLKGMNNGAENLPNVTQYVEGHEVFGNPRFDVSSDWPHPKLQPQRLYLRGDGSLTRDMPGNNEASHEMHEPQAPHVDIQRNGDLVDGTVEFADYSECSASAVQWSLGLDGLLPKACHKDNRTVEEAQNALIFETGKLKSDTYINGPMQADIWMSATQPHAALAIRVSVVGKDGKATPVSTGIQSAAFRAVDEQRSRFIDGVMMQPWHPFTRDSMQPLIPNQPVLVPVEIFPAAALVKKGERLRVSIAPSNQVQGIWSLPQQAQVSGNVTTLYNQTDLPSSVVFPVVPTRELD